MTKEYFLTLELGDPISGKVVLKRFYVVDEASPVKVDVQQFVDDAIAYSKEGDKEPTF